MNENQTLTEFLEDYKEQERQVHELDYANLSEEDRQLLSDFAEKKAFIKDMQKSLDFVQDSTAVLAKEQEGKQVFSLESMLRTRDANKNLIHDKNASKEEYVKDLIVLTKGLDKTTIEEIQKGKDTYEAAILNKQMNTVLSDPEMQKELERQLQERQQEITIKEIRETQERIEEEKRRLEIEQEEQRQREEQKKEPDRTAERFAELAATAALTVITVETAKEFTKTVEALAKDREEKEKLSPDVSISAEIAEDGHAVIKNIEGQEKQSDKKAEIDESEVKQKVDEKVKEVKQNIKEAVDLHSRDVAPKSEKAEIERTTEKAEKKEVAKAMKKKVDIDR